MKLLLKFRQYCMILTAVPGRFRPRGIAVTENTSKGKDIIVQEKTLLPLLGSRNDKFDILFFPGLRKRDFDGPKCREMQTTFEMGKKVKQLFDQPSRNLQKIFFL